MPAEASILPPFEALPGSSETIRACVSKLLPLSTIAVRTSDKISYARFLSSFVILG